MPYLLAALLFGLGAAALYHLMREVSLQELARAIRDTPRSAVAGALLCTAGGYAALIGYDWSALRWLGRRLPPATVATGGFLGYAIGNTVGAGPVTGGAVRYRIYSALGLSAYDIAAISVFGSVAFGTGTVLMGCAALAWHPHALAGLVQLPPQAIRWAALAVMAAVAGLLAALSMRRGEISLRGLVLQPPAPRLMAGQLACTAAEMLFAATALWLLLPSGGPGFAAFLAVFAAAVLAGVISHVPGGIGVFETVILAALPAGIPVEQAAAGLLLYRLVYYLVPFAAALVLLGLGEARIAMRRLPGPGLGAIAPVLGAVSSLAPLALAAMVFLAGAAMMAGSLLPPTDRVAAELQRLVPLPMVEGGALASSAIGACLVVVAHGLLRRVEGAWWLAMAALAAGFAASLAHGLDYSRAAVMAAAFAVLLPARREFYRATRLTRNVMGLRWCLMMACLALALLSVLFFAHKAVPYETELWWQFAADQNAPRALRAALVALVAMLLLVLRFALRPGRLSAELPTAAELDHAAEIIRAQPDPLANVALTGDKPLLFSDSGKSFLMYNIQGRSWIALHDPAGDPAEAAQLAWTFSDAANAANARPVFYSVSAGSMPLWVEMGLALHKFGEEAVVPLGAFSLEGGPRKRLRTSHNRALRDGLAFEMHAPPHSAAFIESLRPISEAWLTSKAGGEKGFSVGAFDPDYLARTPIATVTFGGRTVAFANLWATGQKARATLDLMRHADDAPNGLMEFLFTELLLHYKAEGFAEFSLGNAPLSGLEARRGGPLTARLGAFVYRHGRQFYNFEGLRAFKDKFDPKWEPVYVAIPARANLVAVAADVVALIGGGLGKTLGTRK
nr:bifunctional lysylphosphatidylglycerol flippase/synthetase MprF [Mangrovicoccus sp. HB161399]